MFKHDFNMWFKAAGIRAIKTAAESAIGVIGTTTVVTGVNWKVVLGTVVLSTLLSLLSSVRGLPELEVEGGDKYGE